MKSKHLLACLWLAASPFCMGQEEPPGASFLTVVNLVTLREPTLIELADFALNGGKPIPPGGSSGILAIRPGTHPLSVRNPGASPGSVTTALELEPDQTTVAVCYDEVRKPGTRPILRINLIVDRDETDAPRLSLVSLLPSPQAVVGISGEAVTLQARVAHRRPMAVGDRIVISHRGSVLADFEAEAAVHAIGFLFENPESGEVELTLIQNEKLVYQPPLKAGKGAETR
ncbi:MAG TPA: hypothetical protein PLA50_14545 [Bacteroidia bacterium]|nr:hypothetical protein [Bacteroidia bacterium]